MSQRDTLSECHEQQNAKRQKIDDTVNEAESKNLDFIKVEISHFDCQICMEYLEHPIQCHNGHVVCGKCVNLMFDKGNFNCATCAIKLQRPLIRCLHAEIPDNVVLPCKNKNCKFQRPWCELKNHFEECVHSTFVCPMLDKGDTCQYVGTSEEIMMHMYCYHTDFSKRDAFIELRKPPLGQFLSNSCKFRIKDFLDNNSELLPLQSACAVYKDKHIFLLRYGLVFNHNKEVLLSYEARLVHPYKKSCTRQCTISVDIVDSDESEKRLFCNNITNIQILKRPKHDLDRDFIVKCTKEMIKSTLCIKFNVF